MFSSDTPIVRSEDDQLGRNTFAKQLAQTLLSLNTKDTFTIGLSGKWGSGKTSLVNMTLNELDRLFEGKAQNEKPIVVHFEPWNYADTSQLLTQFLSRLSVEFRSVNDQRNINICQALETYSGAFDIANAIPGFGPVIAAIGKTGANALGGSVPYFV